MTKTRKKEPKTPMATPSESSWKSALIKHMERQMSVIIDNEGISSLCASEPMNFASDAPLSPDSDLTAKTEDVTTTPTSFLPEEIDDFSTWLASQQFDGSAIVWQNEEGNLDLNLQDLSAEFLSQNPRIQFSDNDPSFVFGDEDTPNNILHNTQKGDQPSFTPTSAATLGQVEKNQPGTPVDESKRVAGVARKLFAVSSEAVKEIKNGDVPVVAGCTKITVETGSTSNGPSPRVTTTPSTDNSGGDKSSVSWWARNDIYTMLERAAAHANPTFNCWYESSETGEKNDLKSSPTKHGNEEKNIVEDVAHQETGLDDSIFSGLESADDGGIPNNAGAAMTNENVKKHELREAEKEKASISGGISQQHPVPNKTLTSSLPGQLHITSGNRTFSVSEFSASTAGRSITTPLLGEYFVYDNSYSTADAQRVNHAKLETIYSVSNSHLDGEDILDGDAEKSVKAEQCPLEQKLEALSKQSKSSRKELHRSNPPDKTPQQRDDYQSTKIDTNSVNSRDSTTRVYQKGRNELHRSNSSDKTPQQRDDDQSTKLESNSVNSRDSTSRMFQKAQVRRRKKFENRPVASQNVPSSEKEEQKSPEDSDSDHPHDELEENSTKNESEKKEGMKPNAGISPEESPLTSKEDQRSTIQANRRISNREGTSDKLKKFKDRRRRYRNA